ncbi:class I SAM-dependent methyltransferase [Jatrophihabitans sp. DSM 45814]
MTEAPQEEMALSFGTKAEIYDRIRPGYPDAAVDWALDGVVVNRALDLGAGTGLLTRKLLGRGFAIMALEPDEQMAGVLAEALPTVTVDHGFAEQIPTESRSFDAVFVGQAFHWFNRPTADIEIARVLRPGGVVAIMTNVNPPEANWEDVLHQRVLGVSQASLALPPEPLMVELFERETQTHIPNSEWLDRADFLTLTSTWSWVATASAQAKERVLIEAHKLVDEIAVGPDQLVEMPYQLRIVRATKR